MTKRGILLYFAAAACFALSIWLSFSDYLCFKGVVEGGFLEQGVAAAASRVDYYVTGEGRESVDAVTDALAYVGIDIDVDAIAEPSLKVADDLKDGGLGVVSIPPIAEIVKAGAELPGQVAEYEKAASYLRLLGLEDAVLSLESFREKMSRYQQFAEAVRLFMFYAAGAALFGAVSLIIGFRHGLWPFFLASIGMTLAFWCATRFKALAGLEPALTVAAYAAPALAFAAALLFAAAGKKAQKNGYATPGVLNFLFGQRL